MASRTKLGLWGEAVLWGVLTVWCVGDVPAQGAEPGAPPAPPISEYVLTEVEGVRGGLIYGVEVHQESHEVYLASETMRGGFWGAAHNPNNGTWKSDDGGKSWRRIGPGGRNVKVSAANRRVIYANDRYGLYKTTDRGATWSTILPPEHRIGYKGLDIFRGDHNVVYAGGSGALHVSRDGGKSWQHHKLPANDKGVVARAAVVRVHPTDPNTALLAFTGQGRGPTGLWRTTDGGRSFERIYSGRAAQGYRGDIGISPSDPDVIYCASAYSHDGGKTWKPIEGIGGGWEAIAVHPKDPNVAFYACHGRPVCATITGGEVFFQVQGVERNYDGTEVEGIAIDGERDIVWAGGDCIWKGANASTGKVRLVPTNRGYHDLSLSDIRSAPSGVWACSDAQGMHYTNDGKRWFTTALGMQGLDALHHVAPSPTNPKIVYAGHEGRLYKTTDGGRTWFSILGRLYPHCMVDPVNPDIVYLSTRSGRGGMIRTSDGGASFQEMGNGRFLAIHPAEPSTIFAERPDGFYVSRDRAESFEKISDEKNLGDFFISPSDPKLMFSARGGRGLFMSNDGGRTWALLPGVELKGPSRFTELPDRTIWLSDPKTGLVRSTDQGRTWQKVWDSMGAMTPDPWNPHSLYMITRGAIWWVHPRNVVREEVVDAPPAPEPAPAVVKVSEPFLVDRSNTTYELDRDVELAGLSLHRSLALFNRGLKNIILDGKGRTVRLGRASAIFGDDVEDLTIRNFSFLREPQEGRRRSSDTFPPVIFLTNCRNLTIRNCTFEAPGGTSVFTRGILTDNVAIDDCRIIGGSTRGAPAVEGTGRHVIRNCTIQSAGHTAVRLLLAEGSQIEGNKVKGDIQIRPPAVSK